MNKIVLGLVGEIGSGKTAIAGFLDTNFESETVSFSAPLRNTLDIFQLPHNRENMTWLSVNLREKFGQDILVKAVCTMIEYSQAQMICLPNIRLASDIACLQTLPYFYLVNVSADPEIRYHRLKTRGENADDATKTWEEFLADAQLPTEINIREIAKQAQFTIINNTCETTLFRQIETIIQQIKEIHPNE